MSGSGYVAYRMSSHDINDMTDKEKKISRLSTERQQVIENIPKWKSDPDEFFDKVRRALHLTRQIVDEKNKKEK